MCSTTECLNNKANDDVDILMDNSTLDLSFTVWQSL